MRAQVVVFLVYLSLEGFLKLLSNYHPVVHIGTDIVLWTLISVWVAKAVVRRETKLPAMPMRILILLHVSWILMLVFSPYTAGLYVGIASLKIHLSMIPLYIVGFMLGKDAFAFPYLVRALLIVWSVAFAVTLVQYAQGPGGIFDLGEVYTSRLVGFHEWRPFGLTHVPGGEATHAFFAIPFAIYLSLTRDHKMTDPIIIVPLLGALVAVFVSGVRQLFLGSVIILLIMTALLVVRGRGKAVTRLVALAVVTASVFVGVKEFLEPQLQRSLAASTVAPDIWTERSVIDRFLTLGARETYENARAAGIPMLVDRVREFPFGAGLGRTGSAAGALGDRLTQDRLGQYIQDNYGFQDNFFAAMLT
jgi:hypothetical protein